MITATQDQVVLRPLVRPVAVAILLGLVAGIATSLLQGILTAPWSALVNAAAIELMPVVVPAAVTALVLDELLTTARQRAAAGVGPGNPRQRDD